MPHRDIYQETPVRTDLHAEAYPISGVSLGPADTNYYLARGLHFNVGHHAKLQLEGLLGPVQSLSTGCKIDGCGVPPADFCRTLQCPKFTIPTSKGCLR